MLAAEIISCLKRKIRIMWAVIAALALLLVTTNAYYIFGTEHGNGEANGKELAYDIPRATCEQTVIPCGKKPKKR